jgi:hypothetical protein
VQFATPPTSKKFVSGRSGLTVSCLERDSQNRIERHSGFTDNGTRTTTYTSRPYSNSERTRCPYLLKFPMFLSRQAIRNQAHPVLRLRQWNRVLTDPSLHLQHRRRILCLRSNHSPNRLRSPGEGIGSCSVLRYFRKRKNKH